MMTLWSKKCTQAKSRSPRNVQAAAEMRSLDNRLKTLAGQMYWEEASETTPPRDGRADASAFHIRQTDVKRSIVWMVRIACNSLGQVEVGNDLNV